MVVTLAQFTPRFAHSQVVTEYQSEVVPAFLRELQRVDPALYAAAAALEPSILQRTARAETLLGKRARLGDLPSGDVQILSAVWEWNRETGTLSTTSQGVVIGVRCQRVVVYPDPDQMVVLCDLEMVRGLSAKVQVQ